MLLVTGCGRSGTLFMARALQGSGVRVQHEDIGPDGCVCWYYAVTADSYMSWIPSAVPKWSCIVHQVREPLAAISSITTLSSASWRFVAEHISLSPDLTVVDRAATYWLEWNRLAAARASMTYRVEDAPVERICKLAGLPYAPAELPPRNTHARPHKDLRWGDVSPGLRDAVLEQAREYGY